MLYSAIAFNPQIETSPNPLTSEAVAVMDPTEANPAFVRYFVERQVFLEGLSSGSPTLRAVSRIHLRPEGKIFSEMSQFPCDLKKPDMRFGTREGVLLVAHQGVEVWEKILQSQLKTLQTKIDLQNIPKARAVFEAWLATAEQKYWKEFESKSRSIEFEYYRKLKVCKKGGADSLSWGPVLEKSPEEEYLDNRILGRGPSQRVQGYFTVHGSIRLGARKLNGRFWVDPGASGNVISTDWLKSQGIDIDPLLAGKKTIRSVSHPKGRVLGPMFSIEEFSVGGVQLGTMNAVLGDTDLFSEPKDEIDCCAGIIGMSFLRRHVVEFAAVPGPSVSFYKAENFPHPKGSIMNPLIFSELGTQKEWSDKIRSSKNLRTYLDPLHGRVFLQPFLGRQSKPVED